MARLFQETDDEIQIDDHTCARTSADPNRGAGFRGTANAADPYPTKPVKIIFGFPAASATDVIARAIGQKLSDKWGQPVVIDNRPGAGGNLGSEIAAKQPADGYTIFFGTVANAISASYYSKLNYDYLKDFMPITLVATTPLVLVANNDVPAKSVKELIAYAKANPGTINFGSGGVGTSNHLAGEMFKKNTGTDLVARRLQGHAGRVHGPDERARPVDVRQHRRGDAAYQVGRAAADRCDERARARRRCPMCRPWPKPASQASKPCRGSARWSRQVRRRTSSTRSTPI